MNTGDLYWVELPQRLGHTQSGRRPAILLQGASASLQLPTVLPIPMTTQQEALRFPGTVLVDADADNGLRRPSVALVFQLTAVDKRFQGVRLGSVSQSIMQAIWAALEEIAER